MTDRIVCYSPRSDTYYTVRKDDSPVRRTYSPVRVSRYESPVRVVYEDLVVPETRVVYERPYYYDYPYYNRYYDYPYYSRYYDYPYYSRYYPYRYLDYPYEVRVRSPLRRI